MLHLYEAFGKKQFEDKISPVKEMISIEESICIKMLSIVVMHLAQSLYKTVLRYITSNLDMRGTLGVAEHSKKIAIS